MAVLRTVVGSAAHRRQGEGERLRIPTKAGIAVLALSLLCAACAFTLVDWSPTDHVEVLESAGMDEVLQAKNIVERRERAYTSAEEAVAKRQAALDRAEKTKVELTNALNKIDRSVDHETVQMSKDAAKAEADSDTANELILKAREHEHNAKSDKRHAATTLRRQTRETVALASYQKQAAQLKAKAAAELKDAQRRQANAKKLREVARKHTDAAAALKSEIRHELRTKMARLSASIDASQRGALKATERAKEADKEYSRLRSKMAKHDKAASLAQHKADQAALSAEAADKRAAKLAREVSAELGAAQKDKADLARLLTRANTPQGSTTLRTSIPKTLESKDLSLGPNQAVSSSSSSNADSQAAKELRAAADEIRKLRAAKIAAEKRAERERRAQEALERAMREKKSREIAQGAGLKKTRYAAPKRYENNFEAAMNYLNNDHLDGATGIDDHGRDPVGRETEGRRAFVGVFGRSPQLDSMATANLRQYEQDESELSRANYGQGNGDLNRNIF